MTQAISSRESSCLDNCRPLNISVHCCLVLYGRSKNPVFVPTASGTTGARRHYLFVASFTQQPEIRYLVLWGQIISGDLPWWTDARTTIILI